jgi:hypothetical protein
MGRTPTKNGPVTFLPLPTSAKKCTQILLRAAPSPRVCLDRLSGRLLKLAGRFRLRRRAPLLPRLPHTRKRTSDALALPLHSMGRGSFLHAGRWGLVFCVLAFGCAPPVRAAGHTQVPDSDPPQSEEEKPAEKDPPPRDQTPSPPHGSVAPARPSLYADVPSGGRLLGKPGAIALEGLGRGGHWVAYCQGAPGASEGESRGALRTTPRGDLIDLPSVFLSIGEKEEEMTALLASEASGRYLVIQKQETVFLIDAVTEERLDLGVLRPDLSADRLPDHRSFAFTQRGLVVLSLSVSEEGRHLAHFLPLFDETKTLEQVLASAEPILLGKAPVWRLVAGPSDVAAVSVPEGSTEKAWPVRASEHLPRRCGNPGRSYPVFERLSAQRPDTTLSYAWVSLARPKGKGRPRVAQEAPGFVFGLGDKWVRREDSGRLVLVEGLVQKQITSARCGGRILRADPKTGLFLVACEEYKPVFSDKTDRTEKKAPAKYRFELYLVRPGLVQGLKAEMARTGVDIPGPREPLLFPIRPGAEAALVDFRGRALSTLAGDVQILATTETQALVRRGDRLSLWSAHGEKPVEGHIPALAQVLVEGSAVALDEKMFLMDGQLETWTLPARPLAISAQGYALIPKKAPMPHHLAEGPLLLLAPPQKKGQSTSP